MYYKICWIVRALVYRPFFKKMGNLSYLGKPTFLRGINRITIGRKVRILPGVRLEVINQQSSIIMGNEVSIAQNVHISSGADLVIGEHTAILANSFVTNIDHAYHVIGKPIIKQDLIIKETRIGANCLIGMGASILAGTILGNQCIVGANSVVRGNFPDYCVIAGAPGKVVKRFNQATGEWQKVDDDLNFI